MKVIDPGHLYKLDFLDLNSLSDLDKEFYKDNNRYLQFVKREGEKYPGNIGHYPGTTTQEVLRACVDRLDYVYNQKPAYETRTAQLLLKEAIYFLEKRAARLHNREVTFSQLEAVEGKNKCLKCGHVGCITHKGDLNEK